MHHMVNLVTAAAEPGQKNCHHTGLGDLPEFCIASILRLITPRDVARSACVSPTFRAASDADLVWEKMLPPAYEAILAQAPHPPPIDSSKKKIYEFLSNGVFLQNSTRDYWLDRATGGICQEIGARGLTIPEGDTAFWTWAYHRKGSRLTEVGHMNPVRQLEIRGKLQCVLSPGTYTLSWRLFTRHPIGPMDFSFYVFDDEKFETVRQVHRYGAMFFSEEGLQGQHQAINSRLVCYSKWMEVDVGEFLVESSNSYWIFFSLKGNSDWKSKEGLYVREVVIRPSISTKTATCNEWLSSREICGDSIASILKRIRQVHLNSTKI